MNLRFLMFFFILAVPLAARAELDGFHVGNGQDGALTVTAPNTVVNSYTTLTAQVVLGGTQLQVADATNFPPGALVMLLRTTGAAEPVAPSTTT